MEHNKDQDVLQAYSMINDTVARVGSNIEEECHDWFEDTSRLADKIGATVQESLGGRNKVSSANPQSHYRVNVAIPFTDHLLE